MSRTERLKRQAAERAVEFVDSGMRLGLGTGSTVRHVLEVLAERLRGGDLRDVVGVPTSRDTERRAGALGIPVRTLEQEPELDLTLDGADEVDPSLRLVKGLGGALLWEKIVASASAALVVVADEGKLVDRLGLKAPLPVEVVPFGWSTHVGYLRSLGGQPVLRRGDDDEPFVTDGGHNIIDCRFEDGIEDAEALELGLKMRPGVVETGLFLGMATHAVIGGEDGVRVLGAAGTR